MVLYYKGVKKPQSRSLTENTTPTPTPTQNATTTSSIVDHGHVDNPANDTINTVIRNVNSNLFGSRSELYHALLEDNYNNLSTDDKLVIMYKAMLLKSDRTNRYILICLCVLVIIALKLFSK